MSRGNWQTWRKGTTAFYVPYTDIEGHVSTHMTSVGADKAVAAVVYDDKLIAVRAFGCEINRKFRVASVTKMLTGSAIQKIINAGTGGVTASTLVAAYLGYNSPADSRVSSITVQHLIDHQGGWNSDVTTDPVFDTRNVATTLGVSNPPTDAQIAQYALNNRTLDFAPGVETHYANVGYLVLAEVVRVATGGTYYKYIQDMLASVKGKITKAYSLVQDPYEVPYLSSTTVNSVFGTAPGALVNWPYGGFLIEGMTGAGDAVFTIHDLALYIFGQYTAAFPNPRQDIYPVAPGYSWTWYTAGSLPGTYAMVTRHWDGTHLRSAIAIFNSRSGVPATDDAIAGQIGADADLMV